MSGTTKRSRPWRRWPILRTSSSACRASAPRSSPRCRRSPSHRSINLGQGFPDTDGPAEVLDAAVAAIRAGHNQYPPGIGIPELRARDRRPPAPVVRRSTSTPTPRCSSPRAPPRRSPRRCSALCEPGDEVVTFEPYYDSYAACIALAGAQRRVGARSARPTASFDPDALRARDHAPHPRAPAQLAAQPDRQGVLPRRARARSRGCASSTTSSR